MGNGNVKKSIEAELLEERRKEANTVKLILLGSGESGKSTLVRQMKVLQLDGFSLDEKMYFREHIYCNLADAVTLLPMVLEPLGLVLSEHQLECVQMVKDWSSNVAKFRLEFSDEVAQAISAVLGDPNILDVLKKNAGKMQHLPDSAVYYFECHERIAVVDYIPNDNDIIRCRIMTTGIHEMQFHFKKLVFRIIDVGGQRGQRKKWIHQFQNVQGMIFVTALSDYYKTLFEDGRTNRMHDSVDLFAALINNQFFESTAVLIFFNKTDIFIEKLKEIPLSACFPEAEVKDYEAATELIQTKFLEQKPEDRKVFSHFTNATEVVKKWGF